MIITKKRFSLFFFFFLFLNVFSQTVNQKYWVEFTDKKNTPFSIVSPHEYLSKRAIDRRINQHIPITSSDLPINPNYIEELSNKGAIVLNKSKWLNAVVIETNENIISRIKALPYVKNVTLLNDNKNNERVSKFESESGNFPTTKSNQLATSFNYGLSLNQANQIGADCMHNMGYTGKNILIALLDAGFYKVDSLPVFKRIRDNNQILGTRDFVAGGTSVYEDHAHGMAVLSLIGGYIDDYLIGTAPDANFWLLRTEDAAAEYIQEEIFWTIGAEFADSVGADIINSSLGYSLFDDTTTNHTYSDMDGNTTIITKAADLAASKGILVVSSAGNSGGAPWFKITAPADADSILTVGAVDSNGVITSFSGRGLTYDGRIKPDVCAKGINVTYASQGGGVAFGGGTSFSSPITAGTVACLWQANPGKTNMELIDVIKQSANKYTSPDSIYGYGVPNFCYANNLLNGFISIEDLADFTVYPNPFHTSFQLNFYTTKKENILIELMDVTGKKIHSQESEVMAFANNNFVIDESSNLSSGMYFIKIKSSEKTIIKKLIKN